MVGGGGTQGGQSVSLSLPWRGDRHMRSPRTTKKKKKKKNNNGSICLLIISFYLQLGVQRHKSTTRVEKIYQSLLLLNSILSRAPPRASCSCKRSHSCMAPPLTHSLHRHITPLTHSLSLSPSTLTIRCCIQSSIQSFIYCCHCCHCHCHCHCWGLLWSSILLQSFIHPSIPSFLPSSAVYSRNI